MLKQLRDLYRRPEPEEDSRKLSCYEFPAWLDARDEEIERELSVATGPPLEGIRNALDHLSEAIAGMGRAKFNEELHPRLRDISRKALPGFTKSMGQILSQEPTGDTDGFYATAPEILKGSLTALKGQG